MCTNLRRLLLTALLLTFSIHFVYASEAAPEQSKQEEGSQIDILSKVQNHYAWDLTPLPFGEVELPRIFLYDGQLYAFASTTAAVASETFTMRDHQIVPADGGHITLDLSISTHLLFFWFSAILTMLIFIPLAQRYRKGIGRKTEPKGVFHNMFEVTFEFVRDEIARKNIGEEHYKRFVPYLATAFFTIAFMNLLGLLPWGTSSTADVTVTASLALLTFILTQVNGSKDHWRHVFWFPGVPVWVRFIMMPIEFIGLFTKPFALAIRLFANMLSGKILIFSIIGLIFVFDSMFGSVIAYGSSIVWIAFAVFIYIIKAFVALIQAYIFVILSALFIGMAMEEHGDHELEHAHA